MKPWTITAALGLVLSLLYLACRAESQAIPPSPEKGSTAPAVAPAAAPALPVSTAVEAGAGTVPQEKNTPETEEKASEKKPAGTEKKDSGKKAETGGPGGEFAPNAFPPVVSDTEYHGDAWYKNDCLRCHETGVGDAPRTRHKGMPPVLLQAKCRSCHVLIRGTPPKKPAKTPEEEEGYMKGAFPPMIPDSPSHRNAWTDKSCLLCHETGNRGAPIVKHANLPKVLLKAKCRSCHVQVRSAKVPGR